MGPRRNATNLELKSIWDEALVRDVLSNTKHRAKMWNWLISHPDKEVSDIPFQSWCVNRAQSQELISKFVRSTSKVVEKSESIRGDTTKLLLELQDGHRIETVIMRHVGHATVCVSSQIGCKMGCRFCATGTMGIIGNLTSGEIMEQLVYANSITRIRNVVFMGMGEPLNNYDNLKLCIEFMIDDKRFGLSPKHVTVSTVGVLKSMHRLTEEMPFVNLALSLHAPNQEVRLKIVPAASAHHIDKLMAAIDLHIARNKEAFSKKKLAAHGQELSENELDSYIKRGGGKRPNKITGVMIEYILIRDVNDKEEHAVELANLLVCRRDHVLLNLIPYNPTDVAEDYEPPLQTSVQRFHDICVSEPYVIHTRVRQEKGQDIAGACGQLALVKPGSATTLQGKGETIEIEDYGGKGGKSKKKPAINAMKSREDARSSSASSDSTSSQGDENFGSSISRSGLLCYTNVAIPLMAVTALSVYSRLRR